MHYTTLVTQNTQHKLTMPSNFSPEQTTQYNAAKRTRRVNRSTDEKRLAKRQMRQRQHTRRATVKATKSVDQRASRLAKDAARQRAKHAARTNAEHIAFLSARHYCCRHSIPIIHVISFLPKTGPVPSSPLRAFSFHNLNSMDYAPTDTDAL